MSPDSLAQEKALHRLKILKDTQETVLNEIVLRFGTIKNKINELADIMAERIDLLDPEMEGVGKEQISIEITRRLRDASCEIVDVYKYLPTKYKNKNLARVYDTVDKITEIGGNLSPHLPEECSSFELQDLYDKTGEMKNIYDNTTTYINKFREKIIFVAFQKGYQLDGEKFRRQISHSDFDEDVPLSIKERVDRNADLIYSIGKGFESVSEKYRIAPPRTEEELDTHFNILSVFDVVFHSFDDFKGTGDIIHTFERQYISDLHGKHAAGNSDKFPTKLCTECSVIDDKNPDPDDYEIMTFDTTSTTLYRCMKCGGTDSIQRGMSREQVGDSQAVTMRKAQNVIKWMPLFGEMLHDWNKKYIQPKEDSRKTVIAPFFSRSAIAGKDFSVARKVPEK